MKVLLTTHQFFPEYASGTEILTLSVARELMARGHAVRVLTGYPEERNLADEQRFDEYDFEGIRVHRFRHAYVPMGGQTSKIAIGFDNHLAAGFFSRVLADFQPDVAHFFHLNRLGTGLIPRAVAAGVPAFLTPTDFWAICPTAQLRYSDGRPCSGPTLHGGNCALHFAGNTLKGIGGNLAARLPPSVGDALVRLTRAGLIPRYPHAEEVVAIGTRLGLNVTRLNQLRRIVVPNRMMEQLMLRYGVEPGRIVRSAFGTEAGPATSAPPRPAPRNPLRIGFIGTLAPHKGCHVLIEAFKLLPSGLGTLKIYGRESDFPDYARQLRQRADDDRAIEFCGLFPNAQIAQVMGDLDMLVVPSVWNENTPLVIYSAQAAQCPVVASNVPGISEVVTDGVDGLLFEAGSATALADRLLQVARNPDLLTRLSAGARAPKTVSAYVDELLSVWQKG